MHVKKGDKVQVRSGKDRGKEGEVIKVFPAKSRVIVEGVNIIKKHVRPTQDNPQGGIVEKEAPIHSSNVMLICNSCGEASRTAKKVLEDGKKIRFCKKCGEDVE
nr:50S ribosomal protein L24 [Halonatronum saccharophilum]